MRNKECIAEGPLSVYADHLCIGPHRVPFSEIWSVSVDIGSQVLLRCASEHPRGRVYRLEVPGESPLKWGTLLKAWTTHLVKRHPEADAAATTPMPPGATDTRPEMPMPPTALPHGVLG
jgi:hypothetical protein